MAMNIDTLVKMMEGLEGSTNSLSVISESLQLGQYSKVYEVLMTEKCGLMRDTSWIKRVAILLTDKLTKLEKEVHWGKDDQEAIVSITGFLIDRFGETSYCQFSSSNIFLCLFHINKLLLRNEGMWNYKLQGRLLEAISNTQFSQTINSKTRLSSYRMTMYATTWNEMRGTVKTSATECKLEMLVMAFRWLLADSVQNLCRVALKLQKSINWILASHIHKNEAIIKSLLFDLCKDYGEILDKEVRAGLINASDLCDPTSSLQRSLAEFTFACLTFALHCKDLSIAKMVAWSIVNASLPYISPIFLNVDDLDSPLDICRNCVDSVVSVSPEKLAMHPNFYSNVMTETFSTLKEYYKGLEWLGHWLLKKRSSLDEHLGPFDLFDPPCLSEWGTQWVKLKYEAQSSQIQQLTLFEVLSKNPESEEILNQALLLELNSYFTCKYIFGEAIVSVGEHLEVIGRNECEKALGLLAQAIGFWWGDDDSNQEFCVTVCENALDILEQGAKKEEDNPQILIISGVAKAWLAFMYGKRLSLTAQIDLDFMTEEDNSSTEERDADKLMEPEFTDCEDAIVTGITSLNLNHEHEVASLLISCIDSLYTIVQFDEVEMKKWIDICPALILISMRLCAYKISAFGDTYSSIRAWHVCYVLSRLYDRKYNQLMAGFELYKQMPQSIRAMITPLEELNASGIANASHYMPKAFFSRIDLVRAVVALKEKQYDTGILYLSKVLEPSNDNSNLDATHLVMAEAYYLLAQYQLAHESNEFSMALIEPSLARLTPSALALKAYKLCCGISRELIPWASGWQDLCFNQHLMLVILDQLSGTLQILKESGNMKEMFSYASELINFCQSFGFVSRTIEILLPLAESDLSATSFGDCEEKFDSIYRMLTASDISMGIHRVEMSRAEVEDILRRLEVNPDYSISTPMPNVKITVATVENPESDKYATANGDYPDPSSPTLTTRTIRLPRFLFHSLNCSCYICMHPKIIPLTINYLHLLSRYSVCGDDLKEALSVISMAKAHHVKACLRILFHFERMNLRLAQAFNAKKVGRDALERAYFPFILEPALNLLHTLAEASPVNEIEFIIECYQKIQEGYKQTGSDDISQLASLEILYAALYENYFSDVEDIVEKSNIRETLNGLLNSPSL